MPRLLVVDDDPSIREFVYDYFSYKGYDVIVAADGAEGLRRLREDRPHAVLLDVLLPDTDGVEVLREAKALDPELRVVMLTGVMDDAIGRQALQEGACEYLTKPVNLGRLEQVVSYLLITMTAC